MIKLAAKEQTENKLHILYEYKIKNLSKFEFQLHNFLEQYLSTFITDHCDILVKANKNQYIQPACPKFINQMAFDLSVKILEDINNINGEFEITKINEEIKNQITKELENLDLDSD